MKWIVLSFALATFLLCAFLPCPVQGVKSMRASEEKLSIGLKHSASLDEDNNVVLTWTPNKDDIVLQIEVIFVFFTTNYQIVMYYFTL